MKRKLLTCRRWKKELPAAWPYLLKFSLLTDGIKDIQEKLVPRSRVDDLEDEVKFLKLMCRQMAEDIAKLKKAN